MKLRKFIILKFKLEKLQCSNISLLPVLLNPSTWSKKKLLLWLHKNHLWLRLNQKADNKMTLKGVWKSSLLKISIVMETLKIMVMVTMKLWQLAMGLLQFLRLTGVKAMNLLQDLYMSKLTWKLVVLQSALKWLSSMMAKLKMVDFLWKLEHGHLEFIQVHFQLKWAILWSRWMKVIGTK